MVQALLPLLLLGGKLGGRAGRVRRRVRPTVKRWPSMSRREKAAYLKGKRVGRSRGMRRSRFSFFSRRFGGRQFRRRRSFRSRRRY